MRTSALSLVGELEGESDPDDDLTPYESITSTIQTAHHIDKTKQHKLLIEGYIHEIEKSQTNKQITPIEIIQFIKFYCPIYHPNCEILLNFEYTNKIYVKLNEIAPALETVKNSVLYLQMNRLGFSWNNQYLAFKKVEEEDQDCLEFDYKLIQASNNGIDASKWEIFVEKLNSSNIGINGYMKRYNANNRTTAVAFTKIEHNVLDLMETEFKNCELHAAWTCDEIKPFKWTKECAIKPSEWITDKLNLLCMRENINLYIGENFFSQYSASFEYVVEFPDDSEDESLHINIEPSSILLGMTSSNEKLINSVKPLLSIPMWNDNKTVNQILEEIANEGTYIWTKHDVTWKMSNDEYLQILDVIDEMSQFADIVILFRIWMDITRD